MVPHHTSPHLTPQSTLSPQSQCWAGEEVGAWSEMMTGGAWAGPRPGMTRRTGMLLAQSADWPSPARHVHCGERRGAGECAGLELSAQGRAILSGWLQSGEEGRANQGLWSSWPEDSQCAGGEWWRWPPDTSFTHHLWKYTIPVISPPVWCTAGHCRLQCSVSAKSSHLKHFLRLSPRLLSAWTIKWTVSHLTPKTSPGL